MEGVVLETHLNSCVGKANEKVSGVNMIKTEAEVIEQQLQKKKLK